MWRIPYVSTSGRIKGNHTMNEGIEMLFEETIRSFLGDRAFHIAGQAHCKKSRKEWYRKVIKKIIRKIRQVESSTTHKERLAHWSEQSLLALKHPYNEIKFTLCLLRLLNVLLGYRGGVKPHSIATLAYFQTPSHVFTEAIIEGRDELQDDYVSTLSIRRKLIGQLKEEGKTDFEISLVLNLSEYEVKKLRRGF